MTRSMTFLGTMALTCATASADVIEFDGTRDAWFAAAGEVETIGFTGLGDGYAVAEQYAEFGVHFVDESTFSVCCGTETFPQDGAGVSSHAAIEIVFDAPITAIGVDFPGDIQFDLLRDGAAFYTSNRMSSGGTFGIGNFAGLISTTPFTGLRIYDPVDWHVVLDDLHFGPPIPGPGGLALLGAFCAGRGRRRRAARRARRARRATATSTTAARLPCRTS